MFQLGRLCATQGAKDAILASGQTVDFFIQKHLNEDWGEVGQDDWEANDEAVINGDRLLSVYRTLKGVMLYVITENDRSVTTILLPEEY